MTSKNRNSSRSGGAAEPRLSASDGDADRLSGRSASPLHKQLGLDAKCNEMVDGSDCEFIEDELRALKEIERLLTERRAK